MKRKAGAARALPRDPPLRAQARSHSTTRRRRSWSRRSSRAGLRLTLEDCGGMFVKFGQIASTRSDLLPEVLTTELAQLQSAARPVAADEVREVIEQRARRHGRGGVRVVRLRAAGGGVDRPDPPGGAQDRRARRGEGAAPGRRGHRPPRRGGAAHGRRASIERRVEAARQLGVKRLAEELIDSLEQELDYGAEAASGVAFLEHLEGRRGDRGARRCTSRSRRDVCW